MFRPNNTGEEETIDYFLIGASLSLVSEGDGQLGTGLQEMGFSMVMLPWPCIARQRSL